MKHVTRCKLTGRFIPRIQVEAMREARIDQALGLGALALIGLAQVLALYAMASV